MSKPKRLNGFGHRDRASFVKLDHGLLTSEAWQALSPDATKVLVDLWSRHNGMNNGRIGYAQSAAHACLCKAHGKTVSRDRATKALREVQDKGFMVMMKGSSFNLKTGAAREWRLTAEAAGDDRATRDFKDWKLQNTSTLSMPDRHALNACEPKKKTPEPHYKHALNACNDPKAPPDRHCLNATSNIPGGGARPHDLIPDLPAFLDRRRPKGTLK